MNVDEVLRDASQALTSQTAGATPTSPTRAGRARSSAIVGLGAVLVVMVGLLAYGAMRTSGQTDGASVTAEETSDVQAPDAPAASATEQAAPTVAPTVETAEPAADDEAAIPEGAWVSDGVPADLVLTRSVAAVEMGEPWARFVTQVYGIAGQPGPASGDQQLTIHWVTGQAAPPLSGEPIEVRGGEGAVRADGSVGFEEGAFRVWVNSTTLDLAAKREIAEAVIVGPDGPDVLVDPPGGLAHLGSIDSALFEDMGSSVPADGFSTDYVQGQRSATVMAGPAGTDTATAIFWASSIVAQQIGDRTVAVVIGEHLTQASWVEDGRLIRVLAMGLTEAELHGVIEGARPAGGRGR